MIRALWLLTPSNLPHKFQQIQTFMQDNKTPCKQTFKTKFWTWQKTIISSFYQKMPKFSKFEIYQFLNFLAQNFGQPIPLSATSCRGVPSGLVLHAAKTWALCISLLILWESSVNTGWTHICIEGDGYLRKRSDRISLDFELQSLDV